MKWSSMSKTPMSFSELVHKLKKEDVEYKMLARGVQYMYWAFIPLYFLLTFLAWRDEQNINELISGFFYLTAFLIFAIFFRYHYKEFHEVDYSLPTLDMLKAAAKRYHPFPPKSLWLYFALLLMDMGMYFSPSLDYTFWQIQLGFLGLLLLGISGGIVFYRVKHKPIRNSALKLIAQIEGE